jgi:hypothetical protein
MQWACGRTVGVALLAAIAAGCGSTGGGDALVLQFVSFDSSGIAQSDSVGENSAEVDNEREVCSSGTMEPFTPTTINATFRNNEAADLHLQQVAIAVGSLAPITRLLDGDLPGGRCTGIDQQCSADADCISGTTTGSCVHTETTITGILLFDFSDKQRFLLQPGTYNVTITFLASDLVHTFQTSTVYTVTFKDLTNCTTTSSGTPTPAAGAATATATNTPVPPATPTWTPAGTGG